MCRARGLGGWMSIGLGGWMSVGLDVCGAG